MVILLLLTEIQMTSYAIANYVPNGEKIPDQVRHDHLHDRFSGETNFEITENFCKSGEKTPCC